MNDALLWSLYSFKHRAMICTSDQLKDECEAIMNGQARLIIKGGNENCRMNLVYAENEPKYSKIKEFTGELQNQ